MGRISKIEQICELLRGQHVMGDQDGLREYHAAKRVRDANRKRDNFDRFQAMKRALKNYHVRCELDCGMGVVRLVNADGKEYIAHA